MGLHNLQHVRRRVRRVDILQILRGILAKDGVRHFAFGQRQADVAGDTERREYGRFRDLAP